MVSIVRLLPSASITKISLLPARELSNAILAPSGDHAGLESRN